ncbi:von Willebrand factor A domain-containing protein 5A-like [Hyperolius riggenbachi]|uniref:von Willebrand factor A domain-containing protein 5A-like n=1 Tax=Hyperolius riggenbachi TaxID=752182 RepID=UPI0035A29B35
MPMAVPLCGLMILGSRQPVPLQGIWVDVQVKGFVADVSATLKYKNKEENAVEAVFVFPMDKDSAVYSFEATIEGKKIIADLQEKKEARRTYSEAMSRGQQAFLLEEDESSGDIFSCSVGNLPPHQEAEVTLKYVRELPVEADGAVRFVLPAVLNPRYTPAGHDVSVTATRPQVPVGGIPYTLSLTAHFQSVYGIAKIESNCDITPMEFTDSDKTAAKVSLAEGHKFERDVELLAYYLDGNKPSVIVEAGLGSTDPAQDSTSAQSGSADSIMTGSVAMLNFYPGFPAGQEQSSCGEFIFVMDRSGSMQSPMNSERNSPQRIQSAKETLVLLIKSLPLDCYLNIYGFGSHFESFFPESVEYTQQSMEEAVKKVNEMQANFGGTEILQPLKKIYSTAEKPHHPRQLFLFTDGEIANTKQVIDEVQKNAKKHRCFTFGIGEGASTSLIKGVARAGGGTAEFITGKDRMQPKVLRTLKSSLQPIITDVSLKWTLPPGIEASVLSNVPTSIFHGQKAIIYAQLKGKVEGEAEGEVSLRCKLMDEIVKNDLRFPLTVPQTERPTIHRLAAKALISKLENGTESGLEGVKKKILDTSLQSGVVSSLTAYVAVNKDTKTPVEDTAVRRDIPAPTLRPAVISTATTLCQVPRHSQALPPARSLSQTLAGGNQAARASPRRLPQPNRQSQALPQARYHLQKLGKSIFKKDSKENVMEPSDCWSVGREATFTAAVTDRCGGNIVSTFGLRSEATNIAAGKSMHRSLDCAESDSEEGGKMDAYYGVIHKPVHSDTADWDSLLRTLEAGGESMHRSLDCAESDSDEALDEVYCVLPPPPVPETPAMVKLVALQNADGSWNLTPKLSAILGISEADIKAKNPDQGMDISVWATVLAVIWLHHNCRDQREEWELLERKAVQWATSKAGSSMAEFVRVANELLKSSVDPNVFSQSRETEGGAKMAEGSSL